MGLNWLGWRRHMRPGPPACNRLSARAPRLRVECLEERHTPATFSAARVGDTLVLTQIHPASGAIRIYDDAANGVVSLFDEDNHLVLEPVGKIALNPLIGQG